MSESTLIAHRGARLVTADELEQYPAPPPTQSWFPVRHKDVADTALGTLKQGGFEVRRQQYALSRENARMFAIFDLDAPVAAGVQLSVGIRNSIDKSLPLGFCAGSRVFLCDNLAFRSELMVHKKHTRFGRDRWTEAICQAVHSLHAFRQAEAERIRRFQHTSLSEDAAALYMLQAFTKDMISHFILRKVIQEWRQPSFEEFVELTKWKLLNCFTSALSERARSNPQQYARITMELQDLIEGKPETTPGGTGPPARL